MAITNDELLKDLKQFINAKIDGVENRLDAKIDGLESKLNKRLARIEEDVRDIKVMQNEVLNAIGQDFEEVKSVQRKHDVRLKKLEAKVA